MKRFLFLALVLALTMRLQAQSRHFTFENAQLDPEWKYIGERDASKYGFAHGKLRLKGNIYELHEERPFTFLGVPERSDSFVVETKMALIDAESGDEAGLCVYRSRQGYVQCCLNNYQFNRRMQLRLHLLSHRLILFDTPVGMLSEVWLRVEGNPNWLRFSYSSDGRNYHLMEKVERRLLATDIVGGTDEVLVGMYVYMASTKYNTGYTYGDFDFFDYKEVR